MLITQKANSLSEKSRNIVFSGVTRIYSPAYARGSPFGHLISIQHGQGGTCMGGAPAETLVGRIQVFCSGVCNTQLGRHHVMYRKGSVRRCSGLLCCSVELEELVETWGDAQSLIKPCILEERGLTSGTGARKCKDFPEMPVTFQRRDLGVGGPKNLPSI